MSSTVKPELADAAAEWWADKLRGDVKMDNGDAMGSALGTVTREKIYGEDGIDEDKLDAFEQNLAKALPNEEIRGRNLHIGVDYGPGRILAEAAEDAGIDVGTSTFPWKTAMWIEEERILVSEGYQGERVEYYTTDAWPPTVRSIKADTVEFQIEIPVYWLEEKGLAERIEWAIASDSYKGYNHCIRSIDNMEIVNSERIESEDRSDRIRAEVSCSATVFITLEYLDKFDNDRLFGIEKRVRDYLERADSSELNDELLERLVEDTFGAYDHLGVEVIDVSVKESYDVEAW